MLDNKNTIMVDNKENRKTLKYFQLSPTTYHLISENAVIDKNV